MVDSIAPPKPPRGDDPGSGLWERIVLRVAGPLTRRLRALAQTADALQAARDREQARLDESLQRQANDRQELAAALDEQRRGQADQARDLSARLAALAETLRQLDLRQADNQREITAGMDGLRRRLADDIRDQVSRMGELAAGQQELRERLEAAARGLLERSERQAESLRLHMESEEQARLSLSAASRETGARLAAMSTVIEERALQAMREQVRIAEELSAAKRDLQQLGSRLEADAFRQEFPAGRDFNYSAFEDVFRGPEPVIRERQSVYLPLLQSRAPVIDLGCGRGELLELLAAAGIAASGVESNPQQVERCRGKGLSVEADDFRAWLPRRAAASAGAVCALQVVEHVRQDELQEMIRQAHRILRPGGVLLLETVNPHCTEAMEWFYIDPTHRRPVYPEMLDFLLRGAGFTVLDIRYQCASSAAAAGASAPDARTGMDYSIWGIKAL